MCRSLRKIVFVIWLSLVAFDAQAAESTRCLTHHSDKSIAEVILSLASGTLGKAVEGTLKDSLPAVVTMSLDERIAALERDLQTLDEEKIAKQLEEFYRDKSVTLADVKVDQLQLYVDGQPVILRGAGETNVLKKIAKRLIAFLENDAIGGAIHGSFGWRYRLQYQGVVVQRETFIENNHVRLTTTATSGMGRLVSATLVNDAVEHNHQCTDIQNSLSACVAIGRCPRGPVTRVAERVMDRVLDHGLCRMHSTAMELADGGAYLSSAVKSFLENVRR